ncbi:hypothetical protein [Jiella sonneratiae]|uniref:Uncharacterized protein n=1 Tax=Jiella sonneratiae TaxID=2816856 RepID=A0ABS3J9D2_9HYPH|nr:hypothetical protein [Jiella sonneratiae]MBO0906288.1 hypothetical protein [Jiella sonneratiae]
MAPPQDRAGDTTPPADDRSTRAAADAARGRQGQETGTAADERREALMRGITAELAALQDQLHALGHAEAVSPQRGALEQRAGELEALRERLGNARSPAEIALLRHQVSETLRGAAETMQNAQSVSGFAISSHQLAEAVYHARLDTIAHSMQGIMRQDAQGFAEADSAARRYGVDGTPFRQARAAFTAIAAENRQKGDRVGGIVTDAISAQNTADYWAKIARESGDEDARRKAEHYQKLAEQAEQQAREAVKAEVTHELDRDIARGERPAFTDKKQRAAVIETQTDQRLAKRNKEAIDRAEQQGLISPERAASLRGEMNANAGRAASGLRENIFKEIRSETPGMAERAPRVFQGEKEEAAAASQGSGPTVPTRFVGLDEKAQQEAKRAATPVAQDTSKADPGAKDATPKITPVQLAEAKPAKGTSVSI